MEEEKENDAASEETEPGEEETGDRQELDELDELRAILELAIARITECEAAIAALREHRHEPDTGRDESLIEPEPEPAHWWFRKAGS